jgi:hypothetical protein
MKKIEKIEVCKELCSPKRSLIFLDEWPNPNYKEGLGEAIKKIRSRRCFKYCQSNLQQDHKDQPLLPQT